MRCVDGWFHTGDLARVDADGYFFIVDRKKDMIIRNGFNVYPREIEEVLYEHPAVREAAVIGIPHDEYGEEVAAAVSLKDGASASTEELRDFVKDQVAAYKYPRTIWIVDELPKGPTGKILKREIKRPVADAEPTTSAGRSVARSQWRIDGSRPGHRSSSQGGGCRARLRADRRARGVRAGARAGGRNPELLRKWLFGEDPAAEALVAEVDGVPAGFALFHGTFSTWECQAGHLAGGPVRAARAPALRRRRPAAQRSSPRSRSSGATPVLAGRHWTGTRWRSASTARSVPTVLEEWTNHRLSGPTLAGGGGRGRRRDVTTGAPALHGPTRVGKDRRHRLRWAARAYLAVAAAGRRPASLAGPGGVRGSYRCLQPAARPGLDTARDLLRLPRCRPARRSGWRPRLHRPGGCMRHPAVAAVPSVGATALDSRCRRRSRSGRCGCGCFGRLGAADTELAQGARGRERAGRPLARLFGRGTRERSPARPLPRDRTARLWPDRARLGHRAPGNDRLNTRVRIPPSRSRCRSAAPLAG